MSAICGIVNFDGAPVERKFLRKMAEALAYHGKDHIRCWIEGNVGFTHMAMTTTTDSLQKKHPPLKQGKDSVLAADTRLDNRDELIKTLTASGYLHEENPIDTTLILAAYTCWGEKCAEHLAGAYAAAIWDTASQRLLLLRDRIGEQVLYWYQAGTSFRFASEPVQLLASREAADLYNLEHILAYLLYAEPEPTWTYFHHIHRLPEAHYLAVSRESTVLKRYWSLNSIKVQHLDRSAAARALAERLYAAVSRQVPQQGETGVVLSGGLDSSSIAVEAAAYLETYGRQLHAFTWSSSSGDGIDERQLSSTLVNSRTNIIEHVIEADKLWPLSRYPEANADPNSPETNAYPDLLLTTIETARQNGVSVLMNGIGGDPVIGWLASDLVLLLRGHLVILWKRWCRTGFRKSSLVQMIRRLRKQPLPGWLTERGQLMAREAGFDRLRRPRKAWISQLESRRVSLGRHVQAASLERFDRLSRRTGLRIAAPWHDVDLASLVLSLPDGAMDLAPPGKSLLREAMKERLPETLRNAPTNKRQTPKLSSKGLLQNETRTIEKLLSASYLAELGLVDSARILADYQESVRRQSISPRFWKIITTECWLRTRQMIQTNNHIKKRGPNDER